MSPQPRTDPADSAKRVLVIDDEIETRFLLAEQFRLAGFIVAEANGAAEAGVLLKSFVFDAVVTDVQMPGPMDGLALAADVQTNFPHTVIVVVSGMDLARNLEGTDAAFFQKPYLSSSLIDYVKNRVHSP